MREKMKELKSMAQKMQKCEKNGAKMTYKTST